MAFGDIIQREKGTNTSGSSTTSATFTLAPTAGNLLVAIHMTGAADSAGVSNGTNAYTLGLECANATEVDWVGAYFRIAGASEPQTVTATSSASDENAILLLEIEGPWEALPVDIAFDEERHAAATSYAIGTTATTAQADEVAVAFVYTRAATNNNIALQSWTSSFVKHEDSLINSGFKSVAAATLLLTATQTLSTTYSYPNSAVAQGGIVTFKKQSLGGGGDISATGAVSFAGSADLSATGSLLAAGAIAFTSSADLDAIGQLAATGAIAFASSADLGSGSANDLVAVGVVEFGSSADLDAVGQLAATGAIAFAESADLTAIGSLSAVGATVWASSADLDALGSLAATGAVVFASSANLDAIGDLAASDGFTVSALAALTDANAEVVSVIPVTLHRDLNIRVGTDRTVLTGHRSRLIED